MTTANDLTLTVESFYEGKPVPFATIATAMELSVNDLVKVVRKHEGQDPGYRVVTRSIGPGGMLLRGPASMHFVPAWVE